MHIHKTGALIRASVVLGALSQPTIDETRLTKLDHYAKCVGLAFQIRDDILDVEGETARLGKATGADQARAKPTYPALLGLAGARQRMTDLGSEALACLDAFGEHAAALRALCDYIVARDH